MSNEALKKKIKRLRISSSWKAQHLFHGIYSSAFKGEGLEFSEVRPFQHGDDIRHIDWNVTARLGTPHVKLFQEEHRQNVFFLVDISPSMSFNPARLVRERVAEICALLSFSALYDNNRIALILFSDHVQTYLPPRKTGYPVSRIAEEILTARSSASTTNIQAACDFYQHLRTRHNIIFLLSDFFSSDFDKGISSLSARNSLIGIMLYDQWEKEIPPLGYLPFQDPETKKRVWMDFSRKKIRQKIGENLEEHEKMVRRLFQKNRGDFISISSRQNYLLSLLHLLRKRKKRSVR